MNALLEKIHEHLKNLGYTEEELYNLDASSVGLATEIAMYAHRGQKRDRNEDYFCHPYAVMQNYRTLVGITGSYDCIDVDMIYEYGLVYDGIQELCLLHDVVEDTNVTIEDIEGVFDEFGLKAYFLARIKQPLAILTHKEGVEYEEYLDEVCKNLSASIVKLMDLTDNMNMLLLDEINDYTFARQLKYVSAFKKINDIHHVVEKSSAYKKAFEKDSN